MNRALKQALSRAFEPPPPARREAFLQKMPRRKVSGAAFLLSQAGYIRKTTWLFSALVAFAALYTASRAGEAAYTLWPAAAMAPFLALAAAAEISRSFLWQMEELELCCPCSLPQIITAKALILGTADCGVLFFLALFAGSRTAMGGLRLAVYLFVPYVLTCCISLAILRRVRGQEGIFLCGGAGAGVSCGDILLSTVVKALYSQSAMPLWLGLLFAGVVLLFIQFYTFQKQAEELIWNCSDGN